MTTKELDWPLYRQIAGQAARKVARDYPGIDVEDIEQTIYAKTLENAATFRRMNYGTAALFSVFLKYGVRYANDERISAFHFSDQYHYTTKEVRALCAEALFDRDTFMSLVEKRDAQLALNPEEVIARVIDLQSAYDALPDKHKAILRERYVLGKTLTGTHSKELTRIIDRLAMSINIGRSKRRAGHSGPGGRSAMTNSTAQAITRKVYE